MMGFRTKRLSAPFGARARGFLRWAALLALTALSVNGCDSVPDAGRSGTPVSLWNSGSGDGTAPGFDQTGKLRIALLVPLSGPHARLGVQLRDAATLALFDNNDDAVALLPKDTKGTPDGAVAAAERAIADGAHIVLGPLFSQSVEAIKPTLRAANIQAIAFSNNRAVAGGPVFLIGNHPETQLTALSAQLKQANRRRVALIGPDTGYLRIIRDRLVQTDKAGQISLVDVRLYRDDDDYTAIAKHVEALTKYKQRVRALKKLVSPIKRAYESIDDPDQAMRVAMQKISQLSERADFRRASYQPGNNAEELPSATPSEPDYGTAVADLLVIYYQKLKVAKTPHLAMAAALTEFEHRETLGAVEVDSILLPVGGKTLLVLAPMFEYFNATLPEVRLFGTSIWDSGDIEQKRDLIGSQYVTPLSQDWPAFKTRFNEIFGYKPRDLAAAAFDAITVVTTARKDTNTEPLDAAFITREQGFNGLNGPFRFLPDGSNQKRLYIVELRASGREYLSAWSPSDEALPTNALGEDAEQKIQPVPLPPAALPARPEAPVSYKRSADSIGG
jgi:ABC-type branched-subunit amino acid transport system substrate-binding protein